MVPFSTGLTYRTSSRFIEDTNFSNRIGTPFNIDGIGGGNAVTTKVAMLSRSDDDWADIDYFFAQVSVEKQLVDYKPTCGNMLTAVGPAAIEMGLIPASDHVTEIRIRAVNTTQR